MNERIKKVRKANGLTQTEFGEKIGVKGNTITNYETGLRNPSDAIIKAICREFSVNELWLRTGEGDMKTSLEDEDRFALNIGKLQNTDNETLIRWVNAIAETNPELLEDIEKFFMHLLGVKKEPD